MLATTVVLVLVRVLVVPLVVVPLVVVPLVVVCEQEQAMVALSRRAKWVTSNERGHDSIRFQVVDFGKRSTGTRFFCEFGVF